MSRSRGQLRVPHRYRRVSRRKDWNERWKTRKEFGITPNSFDELYNCSWKDEVTPEQPQSSQTSE